MTVSGLSAGRLADIRARAEAATPGPWEVSYEHEFDEVSGVGWTYPYELLGPKPTVDVREPHRVSEVSELSDADAAHIAGMDPTTTLALLAEVERLQGSYDAAIRELRDWRDIRYRDLVAERNALQGDVARVREVCGLRMSRHHAADVLAALDGPAAGGER